MFVCEKLQVRQVLFVTSCTCSPALSLSLSFQSWRLLLVSGCFLYKNFWQTVEHEDDESCCSNNSNMQDQDRDVEVADVDDDDHDDHDDDDEQDQNQDQETMTTNQWSVDDNVDGLGNYVILLEDKKQKLFGQTLPVGWFRVRTWCACVEWRSLCSLKQKSRRWKIVASTGAVFILRVSYLLAGFSLKQEIKEARKELRRGRRKSKKKTLDGQDGDRDGDGDGEGDEEEAGNR